ncbi:hypothetical protein CP556_03000 [Natrinema sp. CBA1119]|uniref:carboxypeptidase regulatory-like domain-containing protein n=1 Tax=Natrinema sp. CBA1119 TaxID=1608465 RepID=UPI000BFA7F6D|nr:carboxypeptidase regulatory-like domain-containing protein [Natrinema sp. CBA1119]PGF15191.1 hypothetical protein CP556_03000 [Natrinema sp. CBA1119]
MSRNTQQHGTKTRSIQRSVQVLLTISGIVFLLAGLVLAASGASVSSAIGSVTDRFDDSSQPADDIDSSDGDAADAGSGNETDDTDGSDGDTGDSGDGDTDSGDSDTGDGGDDSDGDGDSDDGNTDGDDSDGGDNGDSNDGDDRTHALTVSVIDQDGNAIDGADVSLDDASSDEKTTGGDGEVEWEVEDGTYSVTANTDGYQSAEDSVEIDGDDESIELTLEEEDDSSDDGDGSDGDESSDDSSTVTFIVQDQNGDTLDNATVALERETFGDVRGKEEKTVDQNGEVDFERENGEYSLTVTVDGNESEEQTVEFDGDDTMRLEYEIADN